MRRKGLELILLHVSCWLGGRWRWSWWDEELGWECWERRRERWELGVSGRSWLLVREEGEGLSLFEGGTSVEPESRE